MRYVGNHATKRWHAFDFNQVVIKENGFLDDFKRAYNNGFLTQKATGAFRPAFFPTLSRAVCRYQSSTNWAARDWLTNSTIISSIQTQEVGTLAQTYPTEPF